MKTFLLKLKSLLMPNDKDTQDKIVKLEAKVNVLEAVLISVVARLNGTSAQKASDLLLGIYNNFLKDQTKKDKTN